jgi:iron complex transport system substrate-binding protein
MSKNTLNSSSVQLGVYVLLCLQLVFNFPMQAQADAAPSEASSSCSRIISLAPSTTEIIFSLGLGQKLVGVTNYCKFPPETKDIPKIGALMDTNYEAIVSANPSLIVFPSEHKIIPEFATKFGIRSLAMDHRSVRGILDSVIELGTLCDSESKAEDLVRIWNEEIAKVKNKQANIASKKSVLVAVARESLDIATSAVYLSGRDGFYNELLSIVGAHNVFEGSTVAAASLSPEAFLSLKPDLIIEMAPESAARGWTDDQIVASWRKLPGLESISTERKNQESRKAPRLAIIKDDFADIPGARFINLLHRLDEVIYSDLKK